MINKLISFLDFVAVGLVMIGVITLLVPNFVEGKPWQPGTRNAVSFLFTGIILMVVTRVLIALKKGK